MGMIIEEKRPKKPIIRPFFTKKEGDANEEIIKKPKFACIRT